MQRTSHRRVTALVATIAALGVIGVAVLPAWAAPSGQIRTGASTKPGTSYVGEFNGGHVALVVSADGRQILSAYLTYRYLCSDNDNFFDLDSFRSMPLSAGGSFKSSYDTGPQSSTMTPGATYSFAGTISGKRSKSGAKIVGTGRFTSTRTDPAGAVTTCDTGLLRFTAKN